MYILTISIILERMNSLKIKDILAKGFELRIPLRNMAKPYNWLTEGWCPAKSPCRCYSINK